MDLLTPGMSRRSAEAVPALRFLVAIFLEDLMPSSSGVTTA
jgi:hypothetical protein